LSGENLDKVKLLLKEEFEASGKTWEKFIKQYEAHHVIPADMLEKSDLLRFYYNNGGKMEFNNFDNGIFLKKSIFPDGVHSVHPDYNLNIKYELEIIFEKIRNTNLSIEQKLNLIEVNLFQLQKDVKKELIEKCLKNNIKVNKMYN